MRSTPYLSGVAIAEVTRLGDDPTDVTYRTVDGAAPAGSPGDQTFWVASSEGSSAESLTWAVEPGDWTVVLMNADADAGIEAAVTAGARIGVLVWAGAIVAGPGSDRSRRSGSAARVGNPPTRQDVCRGDV